MLTTLLLLSTIISIDCHVLTKRNVLEDVNQEPQTIKYERELNVGDYLQNFKPILRDYVNTHYKQSLDINKLDKITAILEEFLTSLAADMREVMEVTAVWETKEINDGLEDEKFAEVKSKILEEFTDIQANTADEMVYRLRKNLMKARQKLDVIIKASSGGVEISDE